MIIRKAHVSDVKAIERLEHQIFNDANYPLSRPSLYYHVKKSMMYVLVNDNNTVFGYVLVLIRRKKAKLYSLCISDSQRGKGFAQALLHEVFCELRRMNFETIILEVRQDNFEAIALYEKLNFQHTHSVDSFYKDGCDACIMERSLAS